MSVRNLLKYAVMGVFCVAAWNLAAVAMANPGLPRVPEIDAGSMASAIALVAGGVAVLADRYRRKK